MTLASHLKDLADEAGDVRTTDKGEYSRSGAVFAVNPSPDIVELKLGPEIAEAAARTPDASLSRARGDAWVHFAPKEWDDMAADRLEAWFRVAWKFATR
jgi:hypothetical protein